MTGPENTEPEIIHRREFDRRRLLVYGLGTVAAVVAAGVTGVELVSRASSQDNSCSTSSKESARCRARR